MPRPYDLHALLDGHHIDVMETSHLYLRKAANDVTRGRQRNTVSGVGLRVRSPALVLPRPVGAGAGDYLSNVPGFGDVERRSRRHLGPVIAAAQALAQQ